MPRLLSRVTARQKEIGSRNFRPEHIIVSDIEQVLILDREQYREQFCRLVQRTVLQTTMVPSVMHREEIMVLYPDAATDLLAEVKEEDYQWTVCSNERLRKSFATQGKDTS